MFFNNFQVKIKETQLKFSQESVSILWKMEEARVKHTNN